MKKVIFFLLVIILFSSCPFDPCDFDYMKEKNIEYYKGKINYWETAIKKFPPSEEIIEFSEKVKIFSEKVEEFENSDEDAYSHTAGILESWEIALTKKWEEINSNSVYDEIVR